MVDTWNFGWSVEPGDNDDPFADSAPLYSGSLTRQTFNYLVAIGYFGTEPQGSGQGAANWDGSATPASAVPEPSGAALLLSGLGLLVAGARRRQAWETQIASQIR